MVVEILAFSSPFLTGSALSNFCSCAGIHQEILCPRTKRLYGLIRAPSAQQCFSTTMSGASGWAKTMISHGLKGLSLPHQTQPGRLSILLISALLLGLYFLLLPSDTLRSRKWITGNCSASRKRITVGSINSRSERSNPLQMRFPLWTARNLPRMQSTSPCGWAATFTTLDNAGTKWLRELRNRSEVATCCSDHIGI